MEKLKSNWQWWTLNGTASMILVYVLIQGSTDINHTQTFDPGLESGKWAVRFLLVCLAMTPLRMVLGWRSAIKLRKPAGLWAFGFTAVHVIIYLQETRLTWLTLVSPPFVLLGVLGLIILSALAITSNHWAMKRLAKNWKRLHRLVYLAAIAVTIHAMLATTASKKMFLRDPQAITELKMYFILLILLLGVRLPTVRRVSKQICFRLTPKRMTLN
jgi:methionine sulfoxide reductase heme-binding subunit